ncbi:MAG: hypothetical protein CM15mP17_13290 [Gammaproteobacteria bacterium]|nr:MAG: hypothetical protein CM15mP17_13290 [Gammaproteobacteria bacterium]
MPSEEFSVILRTFKSGVLGKGFKWFTLGLPLKWLKT